MRMKRKHLGKAAGATAAAIALGMTMTQTAVAAAPDPPPNSGAGAFAQSNPSPGLAIADGATVSRDIVVTGQAGTVRDVDVVMNMINQFNGDYEIELTHTPPTGAAKLVRFVTAKPANRAGSFGYTNTRWDDSALNVPSNALEGNADGPFLGLVPEGSMGSLIGRNPNGTWTLTVRDLGALGPPATLDGWTLDVKTALPPTPAATAQSFTGNGGAIPDGAGALIQTIQVSGANTYVTDLDLGTQINHAFGPDLDVVLTSPSGTSVFISNNRGSGSQQSLTTTWDDSAPINIVGAAFTPGSRNLSMVPEGGLSAFIGENPNGVWTLSVADVDGTPPPTTGSLVSWALNLSSVPGPVAPPVGPRPPVTPGPVAPVCVKVNLRTTILGAKRSFRGRTAKIKVKVGNTSRVAARGAKAVFRAPAGFSLAGRRKGIVIKNGIVTVTIGNIPARKARTVTITLKSGARAKLGVKRSPVTVTALCRSKGTKATIKVTLAGAPR